jgi:ADP-L-glycero-D-manno-heptose 6-epimerase
MGAISDAAATDGDLVAATNITLPLWLWAACAERGVPFLYASSATVYGDGAQGLEDDLAPEALAALRPRTLHGWSKLAFDRRVADMLARGIPSPPQWAGLRFFNVYGPNEYHKGRSASAVFHAFQEAASGGPARLFRSGLPGIADGEQRRDFVHVDDCVAVILWLLENPSVSGLFNVGSGQARSLLDLARVVFAGLGQPERLAFVDMPAHLLDQYQHFTEAPLARLREAGYDRPMMGLEDGVGAYVRDHLMRVDQHR